MVTCAVNTRPLVALATSGFLFALAACSSSDDSAGPGDGDGNGDDADVDTQCIDPTSGQGTQTGTCRCKPSQPGDVRIQIANFANLANVQVTIETPRGTCTIDALPVQDPMGNLELGQALFPLQEGDLVTFYTIGGANLIKSCVVTALAVQDGTANALLQGSTLDCDGFSLVDP